MTSPFRTSQSRRRRHSQSRRPSRRAFRDLLPHKAMDIIEEYFEDEGFSVVQSQKNVSNLHGGGVESIFEKGGNRITIQTIRTQYLKIRVMVGDREFSETVDRPQDISTYLDDVLHNLRSSSRHRRHARRARCARCGCRL